MLFLTVHSGEGRIRRVGYGDIELKSRQPKVKFSPHFQKEILMSGILNESYQYKHISASALVKNGAGWLGGWLVNSSTSGTLTIYDNTAASGTIVVNAIPLTAGQYIPFPSIMGKGIYAVIGGTADITILYN